MSFIVDVLNEQSWLTESRQDALGRVFQDPGIPTSKGTTESFWMRTPHPTVSKAASSTLPSKADIVIIGSGIAGVSVAYELLEGRTSGSEARGAEGPSIVMLEAREASSGATGRNGGHLYAGADDYTELKISLGQEEAMKIVRFRFDHLRVLFSLAEQLGIAETTQARPVESACVYLDEGCFAAEIENLHAFQQDMPEEAAQYSIYGSKEAQIKFGLSETAVGVITHPAGAIWPYKLTTSLLQRMQELYPNGFKLETQTPVANIVRTTDRDYPYELATERGLIRAIHVVHCTNAYASHLLPGLSGLIFPVRGQMSAQTPGNNFKHQGDSRSWIIHNEEGYDYLTQLPIAQPFSDGEMMLGGGIIPSSKAGLAQIGVSTDDTLNSRIKAYLSGTLQALFRPDTWGTVEGPAVKAMWTGIMGFSVDGFPWVGQLPSSMTGREPHQRRDVDGHEWIAAGFSGEGMVHAWLCGKAVAQMLQNKLNNQDLSESEKLCEWLPKTFIVTQGRIARSKDLFTMK